MTGAPPFRFDRAGGPNGLPAPSGVNGAGRPRVLQMARACSPPKAGNGAHSLLRDASLTLTYLAGTILLATLFAIIIVAVFHATFVMDLGL